MTQNQKAKDACKKWKDNHKTRIAEYNKNYYQSNKENKPKYLKYSNTRKVKVLCCCGRKVQKQNFKKHQITSIHQSRMIIQEKFVKPMSAA